MAFSAVARVNLAGVASGRASGSTRRSARVAVVRCDAQQETRSAQLSRRDALQLAAGSAFLTAAVPLPSLAAKTPKGFVGVRDPADGYQFFYPFGWQEVSIPGQEVVFKDVIEPLESVSVNILDVPDKSSITEYGDPKEVAFTLADKVLTPPNQPVEILKAKEDTFEGVTYYTFEFTVDAGNYKRHAVASVAVNNHKFYTLLTGSNERRWNKTKDKLLQMVDSFSTFPILQ
uniref:PsbP C-terminal domain-containing protein n=1 Tax=Tetraselmis chuii TaxID=63592 RepID=A0A7S1XAT4_9CHLO|mmetsp:Transcript_6061/g.10946  ORF Transcript_6061/g.10946 Transcript_6061/m.10946 type:complete len:231 (+) Transcript_6061:222-914(+)